MTSPSYAQKYLYFLYDLARISPIYCLFSLVFVTCPWWWYWYPITYMQQIGPSYPMCTHLAPYSSSHFCISSCIISFIMWYLRTDIHLHLPLHDNFIVSKQLRRVPLPKYPLTSPRCHWPWRSGGGGWEDGAAQAADLHLFDHPIEPRPSAAAQLHVELKALLDGWEIEMRQ